MAYDFAREFAAQNAADRQRQQTTGQYGAQVPIGTRAFGTDPETFANVYAEDVAARLKQRDQAAEDAAMEEQRRMILGAMQPSTMATEAAREQARGAGAATLGAARSLMGAAGTQTAALGALGAGAAQQAGFTEARQVQAQEASRNALAQAQLAEMLRQQEAARLSLERGDIAQALGAQRALLIPEMELQQQYATAEAERARRLQGATAQGVASIGAAAYDAYAAEQKRREDELKRELGF